MVFAKKIQPEPFAAKPLRMTPAIIKPHVGNKELPKRARYYQSVGDGVALSKDDFYTNLKEQYIIFLCPIDIFGHGFPVYHFENREKEDPSATLNDRTFKNF